MKLWDKGINIDEKIEQFTVGNDREIDMHIVKYDIQASIAHAQMLQSVNLLTHDELKLIVDELQVMQQQFEKGEFTIDSQFEDVHSKIEFELIQKCGDIGQKNSYRQISK